MRQSEKEKNLILIKYKKDGAEVMLYKKNSEKTLSKELFEKPTSEYRAAPFWAWNCKLEKDVLERQIGYLKEMGFGGFHMHSRSGVVTQYLGKDFMDLVKFCVKKAKDEDMLAWLYDEDRWPSGFAGGYVTKEKKFRTKNYVLSPENVDYDIKDFDEAVEMCEPYFICAYDIKLDKNGFLESYKRIGRDDKAEGEKRYLYMQVDADRAWFNNQSYVDTMNKDAMKKFIDVTYESYKNAVGEEFDNVVPAIFTDEPQIGVHDGGNKSKMQFIKELHYADEKINVGIPWTFSMDEEYKKRYGVEFIDIIPEIVWALKDNKPSKHKYNYHKLKTDLFVDAFAKQCGKWCDDNGIKLTGHLMMEDTLATQTEAVGDAMRSYPYFGIPGIDLLCDGLHYRTAKQAQSAAHQFGKEGVLSELYGVTNWDFDFRGHKFQGDWQAALGITVRVPHLAWVSMEGEAKRDYPASINYQSPWYKKYSYVEDHFARVNTALTRGKPNVRVAVVHPVESCWLYTGAKDSVSNIRAGLEKQFVDTSLALLETHNDYDYINEDIISNICKDVSAPLKVGEMSYDVVIVSGCATLRKTTLEILKKFKAAGGKLIFIGECPKYIDLCENDEIKKLYNESIKVNLDKAAIAEVLSDVNEIEIKYEDGRNADDFIYNMRNDSDGKWVFIARKTKETMEYIIFSRGLNITFKGEYTPVLYDTLSGEIKKIPYKIEHGNTKVSFRAYASDSFLIKLCKKEADSYEGESDEKTLTQTKRIFDLVDYSLSEENVLILDRARYAFDDGEFNDEEEILKIDNFAREWLGWKEKGKGRAALAQPWVMEDKESGHSVTLEFEVNSVIDYKGAYLAIENPQICEIKFNGEKISNEPCGYFTDEAIKKIKLPEIKKGKSIITVKIPIAMRRNLEWAYVLGDFGVDVFGVKTQINEKYEKIGFSSLTEQRMPFYSGNVTYKFDIETDDCDLGITTPLYRGAVIDVKIDGEEKGNIAYSPYELRVKDVKKGTHKVEITLYGTRFNSFGTLHSTDDRKWIGPQAWSSEREAFCYEYMTRKMGLLQSPMIKIYK